MFKGFYNLTSGMLTHQHNLNVIANNMVNISTAGFKQERYTATTFDEVMYSRVGNKDGQGSEIGQQSYIRAASEIATDVTQGTLEPTGMALDFAIDELGLYLVTHADDQEVLQLYWSYINLSKEGREKYQKLYGPLLQTDLTLEDGYAWLRDPWPWDVGGNS